MTEAAIALLIERGIAGTTLAAVGERAGYSRGLATHRFGSKDGLLAHVHDSGTRNWLQRLLAEVGDLGGIAALTRAVNALHGFIAEAPDELRAMYILRYANVDSATCREGIARAHKAQRRDVQRWIKAGQATGEIAQTVDPVAAAELFCALFDGLVYRWLINPSIPVKAIHEQLRLGVRESLTKVSASKSRAR